MPNICRMGISYVLCAVVNCCACRYVFVTRFYRCLGLVDDPMFVIVYKEVNMVGIHLLEDAGYSAPKNRKLMLKMVLKLSSSNGAKHCFQIMLFSSCVSSAHLIIWHPDDFNQFMHKEACSWSCFSPSCASRPRGRAQAVPPWVLRLRCFQCPSLGLANFSSALLDFRTLFLHYARSSYTFSSFKLGLAQ